MLHHTRTRPATGPSAGYLFPDGRPPTAGTADRARRRLRFTLCVGIALAAGAIPALAQDKTVTDTAIVNAGGTVSADRFRLTSTIGEAVAGPVSAGPVRVVGGFLAKFGAGAAGGEPGDGTIFRDGFEAVPYPPAQLSVQSGSGGATP